MIQDEPRCTTIDEDLKPYLVTYARQYRGEGFTVKRLREALLNYIPSWLEASDLDPETFDEVERLRMVNEVMDDMIIA